MIDRRRRSVILLMLTAMVMISVAAGSTIAQSTAPASAPAPAADRSTPRGALRLLAEAMDTGDAASIRAVLKSDKPLEKRMVEAFVSLHDAKAKFAKAAQDAFGPEEAKKLIVDRTQQMAGLAAMPEKINGETATVGEAGDQLQLFRVNGKWVVPVLQLAGGADEASVNQVLGNMTTSARIYNEVTEGVQKELYKTPEEAVAALNG